MATANIGAAVWIAISAQVLSSVNIRGSYPLKLLILSGAVLACAVCAALGTLAGGYWIGAAVLMAGLAFLGGFVRQSGDHGPGIAIAVLLLYLLSLDHPGDVNTAAEMFLWVLEGGILALLSTLIAWAFVPFNPFRRSIALTWKTLAEWLQIFSGQTNDTETPEPVSALDEKELALRSELNDSIETLSRRQAIAHAKQNRYSYQLVELRRIVSEAGNAASALRTVTETVAQNKHFPEKLFHYALDNMRLTAQRIAISIVTHKGEDIYTVRIAIERVKQSLSLLKKNLQDESLYAQGLQVGAALDELLHHFEQALSILEQATGRPGKVTFFLHNLLTGMTIPQRIPLVKFEFNSRSFTFRFSLRLALGMGIGIALYKIFHIPHGYWIAMTTMIVLQPEYGATMTKAFNRTKGTVLGAITGSLLFLIPFPLAVNIAIVVACTLLMTYFIPRNYGVAAFFITVMVIALFHLLEPVTWQLGGIRIINTLAGCGLALLGGYAFWPLWERFRFPTLMAGAVQANRQYLKMILANLEKGKRPVFDEYIRFRREAEMTNNNAFLSLRRMEQEPEHEHRQLEQFYIIAGHNIRITRLINTLNQQLKSPPRSMAFSAAGTYGSLMEEMLQPVEDAFERGQSEGHIQWRPADVMVREARAILDTFPRAQDGDALTVELMERIARETIGMYNFVQQQTETRKLLIVKH
jgi:uncharacterized membrane protein YccC